MSKPPASNGEIFAGLLLLGLITLCPPIGALVVLIGLLVFNS